MAGLRRITRMYGGMIINGVRWVWDYAAEEPVKEADMPGGSERWKASERAKWQKSRDEPCPTPPRSA